ncbi:MAG TPA: NHLP leader peptide family RiPP precursor [Longimicrobium sp.]|jgi:hypothetical protein
MSSSKMSEKLLEQVVHRAGTDRAFRQQLLADPAGAIHGAYGVALPAGFRIRFVEKDPAFDVVVVLPELCGGDDELSDDDLEKVAGGTLQYWNDDAPPPPSDPPPPPPP